MNAVATTEVLDQFTSYYRATPWLGLLRYLEVAHCKTVAGLCLSPVLDLGCGDGFVANHVFERRICAGIDIDEEPLRLARSSGTYNLLVNADARHLPFKAQTFATVYSNGAMEHFDELDSVLEEIARILMRGGTLVTLVPSDRFRRPVGSFSRALGAGIWKTYNQLHRHVNLLSPAEWHHRLIFHGLSVKGLWPYGNVHLAQSIAEQDLCSKFHVSTARPFFHLRHSGNLGRLCSATYRILKTCKCSHCLNEKGDGYWLMILAVRT